MTFRALLPHSVTIVRYDDSTEDAYGNPVRAETGRSTSPGRLWQVATEEREDGENTVVDRWKVFLPAGTALDAGDELLEGGRRFEVLGTPEQVYAARTVHHIEAQLRYVGAVA